MTSAFRSDRVHTPPSALPPPAPPPPQPSLRPGDITHQTGSTVDELLNEISCAQLVRPETLPLPDEEPRNSKAVPLPNPVLSEEQKLSILAKNFFRDSRTAELAWRDSRMLAKDRHVKKRMQATLERQLRPGDFARFELLVPIEGRARDAKLSRAQQKRLESILHAIKEGIDPFAESGVRSEDVRKFLIQDGHHHIRNVDLYELLREASFTPDRSNKERFWTRNQNAS